MKKEFGLRPSLSFEARWLSFSLSALASWTAAECKRLLGAEYIQCYLRHSASQIRNCAVRCQFWGVVSLVHQNASLLLLYSFQSHRSHSLFSCSHTLEIEVSNLRSLRVAWQCRSILLQHNITVILPTIMRKDSATCTCQSNTLINCMDSISDAIFIEPDHNTNRYRTKLKSSHPFLDIKSCGGFSKSSLAERPSGMPPKTSSNPHEPERYAGEELPLVLKYKPGYWHRQYVNLVFLTRFPQGHQNEIQERQEGGQQFLRHSCPV